MNTNTEVLRLMKEGFAGVNKSIKEIKNDIGGIKGDIGGIKGDIAEFKNDFERTAQATQEQFMILQEKIDRITPKKEPVVGRLKTKAALT